MIIQIPGSKSLSNRLLILNYLLGDKIELQNLSTSDDTKMLVNALNTSSEEINLGLAGTSIRFLISYFSIQKDREVILKGDARLNDRPIEGLVEVLTDLGAEIKYLNKRGYPPILVRGKVIKGANVKIKSNVSSQYISSLLLIAPFLEGGMGIELSEEKVSYSYVETTLSILKKFGVKFKINSNFISIEKGLDFNFDTYRIESDWTSASYYYSLVSLTNKKIELREFCQNSFQADRNLVKIYGENFGVNTKFENYGIKLERDKKNILKDKIKINLIENPDIAQTILVTCFGLKLKCKIKGLKTLKIKETDRLFAMKNELNKFNVDVEIDDDSIEILGYGPFDKNNKIIINTYNDHRMAMSFAPLLFLGYRLEFDDESVVNKSYPNFWKDFFRLR